MFAQVLWSWPSSLGQELESRVTINSSRCGVKCQLGSILNPKQNEEPSESVDSPVCPVIRVYGPSQQLIQQ